LNGAANVPGSVTNLPSPYTLDPPQLEAALGALRKASETFRLTPLEDRLYLALGICVKVAILGSIATAAALAADQTGLMPLSDTLIGVPGLVFLGAGMAAAVLLLVNFSLVHHAFRQHRLLKQLGLYDVFDSVWKANASVALVPGSSELR